MDQSQTVSDNDSQLEPAKYPLIALEEIPVKEKDKLLHRFIQMWLDDQVGIDDQTGKLLLTKPGLNKFRKWFMDVVKIADYAAKKYEADIAKMASAAGDEKREKTVEDRLKGAGLVSLTAQKPKNLKVYRGK